MRDEVLSSVGEQDMDTTGKHLSVLENIELEFDWEDADLKMDAFLRSFTWIHPFVFQHLPVLRRVEGWKPDSDWQEQDKENSPPPTTTHVSKKPTQTIFLMRSRLFGLKTQNVPDYLNRNLFEYFILSFLCMFSNINYFYPVSFYHNFFQKLVRHVWGKSRSSIVIIIFDSSDNFLHIWSPSTEKMDAIVKSKVKVFVRLSTGSFVWTVANAIL